jgi:DNA mismatch repair protein PMS2
LKSYDDLETLSTFGFRGEALSSLAALSTLVITTARKEDAPKGSKLYFETSGRLNEVKVVPAQQGTIVSIENIFQNLPVRRKELERTIKREYGKVLSLLNAYACIAVGVKFTISNAIKGKKSIVFSTKANKSTKENIANVFGAKTLSALTPLDLQFVLETSSDARMRAFRHEKAGAREVSIMGHISRPTFGEGRLLPDRQMFFVNGRPCGLPQIAKVFNEVYKSFNLQQSPFIFADLRIDTGSYDVNVSPDKRTILLHDQQALLDSLRNNLAEMFNNQEQTVPQNNVGGSAQSKLSDKMNYNETTRSTTKSDASSKLPGSPSDDEVIIGNDSTRSSVRHAFLETINRLKGRDADDELSEGHTPVHSDVVEEVDDSPTSATKQAIDVHKEEFRRLELESPKTDANSDATELKGLDPPVVHLFNPLPAVDIPTFTQGRTEASGAIVKNAFDRARPRRQEPEMATITIGDTTTISPLTTPRKRQKATVEAQDSDDDTPGASISRLSGVRINKKLPSEARSPQQRSQVLQESVQERPPVVPRNSRQSNPLLQSSSPVPIIANSRSASGTNEAIQPVKSIRSQLRGSKSRRISSEEPEPTELSEDPIDSDQDSDLDYVDEESKKIVEDAKVAQLIADAEEEFAQADIDLQKRTKKILQGPSQGHKSETLNLIQNLSVDMSTIENGFYSHCDSLLSIFSDTHSQEDEINSQEDDISRLELTISKPDFPLMRIVGQFNLGFILTTRSTPIDRLRTRNTPRENLFIIDQHASSEKAHFERLTSSLMLESQPLVTPLQLHLTAVEEEVLLSSLPALRQNGFTVSHRDDAPVGQRCSLLTLPIAKNIVFTVNDLEELLTLLADAPSSGINIPRPGKVRKLLASKACRGSVMIGKALTEKQMRGIVSDLGGLEKPWNCPHGRPTMRHLCALDGFEGWDGAGEGY